MTRRVALLVAAIAAIAIGAGESLAGPPGPVGSGTPYWGPVGRNFSVPLLYTFRTLSGPAGPFTADGLATHALYQILDAWITARLQGLEAPERAGRCPAPGDH